MQSHLKGITYFRLIKNGKLVGFSRAVTEFLPLDENLWRTDEIESDRLIKLALPPMGIEGLPRKPFHGKHGVKGK